MAVTSISDIFDPEVLADQLAAKFPDQLVFGKTSVVSVNDDVALGFPGTKFKIPSWKRMSGLSDMTENIALSTNKIQSMVEMGLVQRGGGAWAVNDWSELVSKADPVAEIVSQIGRRAAEYLDGKLVSAFEKTPNVYDASGVGAGTLDVNALVTGLISGLGDNYSAILSGGVVVMHSKVFGDLMKLGLIQNLYQAGIPAVQNGMFYSILGLPIFLSDRVTSAVVSSNTIYNTYIAGPGALGLFYQRQVVVEYDRDILLKQDIISADVHFAAHLFGYDENTQAVIAEQNKSIHAVLIKSK